MVLEDLVTEFLSMPKEDAFNLLMQIRASRRISKKPVVAKPRADKKEKNTTINMDTITPEMASILLKKLQGVAKK